MVLVFILCTIIILITLLICFLIFSTIRLKVKNFQISNIPMPEISESKEKYKIEIALYLFNKLKWLKVTLNQARLKKIYGKIKLEKINLKNIEQNLELKTLTDIMKSEPQISFLDLHLKIGTEDVIITSFIVFIISTLISVILPYKIKEYQKDKYKYSIKPIYMNKNMYEIKFSCIFEVKMVHIINIIYVFLKRRRGDKNERTSNRRSYGYSYE